VVERTWSARAYHSRVSSTKSRIGCSGGQEIEDHWHEVADILDTRSLSVEVGDEGSFMVEKSVLVAEVGAVVFKGQ
jgi:hypothetical protein